MPWVLLAPVVAMASAWLLLDQVPNAAELAGGLMLLAGALVAQRARRPGSDEPPMDLAELRPPNSGLTGMARAVGGVVTVSTK